MKVGGRSPTVIASDAVRHTDPVKQLFEFGARNAVGAHLIAERSHKTVLNEMNRQNFRRVNTWTTFLCQFLTFSTFLYNQFSLNCQFKCYMF